MREIAPEVSECISGLLCPVWYRFLVRPHRKPLLSSLLLTLTEVTFAFDSCRDNPVTNQTPEIHEKGTADELSEITGNSLISMHKEHYKKRCNK